MRDDETSEKEESAEEELDDVLKTGGTIARRGGETIRCLSIVGQVEGHYALPEGQKATKYEHLIPLLVSVEESDEIDGLLLILNTMGGDVEAGLALAELVASMQKPTVSLVLGGGHSIGVPLAVSAKKSFIVPSATMTIHPVRISGTVIGAPQTYYSFERMQDRIVDFIVAHSAVTEYRFREMLMQTDEIATDVGSVIDGKEAVACGLIGAVGGLSDALAALREMIKDTGGFCKSPPAPRKP
ncbi:MAG: ATP-dependent Clp protease proteolytic subunit [Clostridia bacterium]|nr:ATP-dependent Clp protease proteolytic subunit [Clostridia bacterium]